MNINRNKLPESNIEKTGEKNNKKDMKSNKINAAKKELRGN